MKYAVVNKKTNVVENCVIWDGDESKWKCPDSHMLIEEENAGIGDIYIPEEKDFYRKLSTLHGEMPSKAKKELDEFYRLKKEELNSHLIFVNPKGELES